MAAWVFGGMLTGDFWDFPVWMKITISPAIYVTFGLWPIYIAWVVLSKRLSWREKAWWLFIVIALNMLGMPIFYVFMIRRYLGLEVT